MPVPLSALDLRRQDAIERYLAGDPIETICREMGCAKSWLYKWTKRYEASKPTWVQERSRRPRRIPTQTPEALARAIIHLRDSLSPGESRSVSAQVIREHLGRHPVASLPSLRTIYRILKRHPRRCPDTQGDAKSHVAHGAQALRATVDGRENPHGETVGRDARSPHQRKAPEQSRPGATASRMEGKNIPKGA